MMENQETGFSWTGLILGVMVMSMASSCKADSVQVFPEPWQVLEPGKPFDSHPKVEVVSAGSGAPIQPGDLVQLHIRHQSPDQQNWKDRGEWWIWIGFRTQSETSFFSYEPEAASALVGMPQGTVFKFLEAKRGVGTGPQYAGKLFANVFGDTRYYSWRKTKNEFATLYASVGSGVTAYEIKRVCKGKAQYRTVRLFDDSYVQRCTFAPIRCEMLNTPREGWVDEAKIEAVCSDGKTATFQYGPVASRNGKEWTGPVNPGNYFTPWEKAAWDKLPVGVQLK